MLSWKKPQTRGQQVLVLPLTCCVTLSKLLSLSLGLCFLCINWGERQLTVIHPTTLWNHCPYYPHLIDEETEEQGEQVTCLVSYS